MMNWRMFVPIASLSASVLAGCASRPAGPPPVQGVPAAQDQSIDAAPYGQPIARSESLGWLQQQFAATAGDRVFFDLDSSLLTADSRETLARQAKWLVDHAAVQVRVAGNCDERGTREYNLALGARRAHAARNYLVTQGVAASRLTTVSYGKERPIEIGSNETAWARNRNAQTVLIELGAR